MKNIILCSVLAIQAGGVMAVEPASEKITIDKNKTTKQASPQPIQDLSAKGAQNPVSNIGDMHDMKDIGGMHDMKDMGSMHDMKDMGSMHDMKDMGGMHDMKDMGSMHDMKDMGSMHDMKDMGGMHDMKDMGGMHDMKDMKGMLGSYSMTREASGTSWQPDSATHDGIHTMAGEWSVMTHGFANAIYDRQGGPRGDSKTLSQSMLMVMGQRQAGIGTLGLRGMFSLDPLMGKSGYPELFQTGESADGKTRLIDRQHPHDLAMEIAATYSVPLSGNSSVFGYLGLPGEPALGPSAFMHRYSGAENPEAPITHHWLDSTHISYGVATLGYVYRNWKIEASSFHGREPDQFRYNIETGRLDSSSARLTWNPTANWSAQISRGNLHSPEALEPDVNVVRTTASVTHNLSMAGNTIQTTLAWGRNQPSIGQSTSGYLLESALALGQRHTVFGRVEQVDKNELFTPGQPMNGDSFKIGKASLGYIYDFVTEGHFKVGVGGVISAFSIPSSLNSTYGSSPESAMVFLRVKLQ